MPSIVQSARARHTRPGADRSRGSRGQPMIRSALAMVVLVLATTTSVYADDELDTLAAGVERTATSSQAERAAVDRMAKALSTAGRGDLYIAHRIATRGGHPVDKVVAARRSGATWAQIAEEAGVEPV